MPRFNIDNSRWTKLARDDGGSSKVGFKAVLTGEEAPTYEAGGGAMAPVVPEVGWAQAGASVLIWKVRGVALCRRSFQGWVCPNFSYGR